MSENFAHLNKQQREAVLATEGALLILAGAGSGKTTVLINRIANIIGLELARPSEILAITFTNKAAKELKDRLYSMLGNVANGIWAHTFHATCMRILRKDIDKLGYGLGFNIFDRGDQKTLVKQCLKTLQIEEKMLDYKTVLTVISKAKDEIMSPDKFAEAAGGDFRQKQIARVYELYQRQLEINNALDFDDIIIKTVELLKQETEIRQKYQQQFKYILVDEYQDTNKAQFELVRLLAGGHGNLCVVGDDDQSIYKFRGATIENILNFEKHFAGAKVIKLEQNYRSTQNILDAANHVIRNNASRKNKALWTDNGVGERIDVVCLQNEKAESSFVANQIQEFVSSGMIDYKEFAILYRTNAQSRVIEEEFIKRRMPYKVVGGLKFHDRKEVRDLFAYLRLLHNRSDDISLKRIINVPSRKIGKTTIDAVEQIARMANVPIFEVILHAKDFPALEKVAAKLSKFVDVIDEIEAGAHDSDIQGLITRVLQKSGYIDMLTQNQESVENQTRLENLNELLSIAKEYQTKMGEEASLGGFLEEMALYADVDSYDESSDDGVVMMTLHSSKGLEFPVVFMVGMEQNIFPSSKSMFEQEQMDEERRLCYVGITRAKKKLFMTRARMRMLFGKTDFNPPSQFLREIPTELTSAGNDILEL